jgi:hypothetical protein
MNPKPVAWDTMCSDNCFNNPGLGKLSSYASNVMIVMVRFLLSALITMNLVLMVLMNSNRLSPI